MIGRGVERIERTWQGGLSATTEAGRAFEDSHTPVRPGGVVRGYESVNTSAMTATSTEVGSCISVLRATLAASLERETRRRVVLWRTLGADSDVPVARGPGQPVEWPVAAGLTTLCSPANGDALRHKPPSARAGGRIEHDSGDIDRGRSWTPR